MSFMEQKNLLYNLLSKYDKQGVRVIIGTENEYEQMKECSIVMATYSIGDKVLGTLGLIGPTRMEYSKAVSVVRYVGETVSKYLTSLFEE